MLPTASASEIHAQLERLLASPTFRNADSLSRLLRFLIEETLAGRAGGIKEYSLGVAVFDRGDDFDPKSDTIVRVQARRLRAKLDEYYKEAGGADPIAIELPKGAYVPEFRLRQPASAPPVKIGVRRGRWRWAGAAVVVLCAAGSFAWAWTHRAPVPSLRLSVAVLPLDNLSGDPSQEYLADGLTEQLITDLSRFRALRVISRSSVMQFKNLKKDLPGIARELKVGTVVEGSMQRVGERLRVTVQLIDAATNTHVWSERYDRDVRAILEMQQELATTIAGAINGSLASAGPPPVEARAPDPAAHRLYLQGRYELNQDTEQSLRASAGYFEEAIAKDPSYARPYAGLARAHIRLSNAYDAPSERMPQARSAAMKAITLDPDLAEAHVSLAMVHMFYDWNWDKTAVELRRAVDLNPNLAEAHQLYANYYTALGRWEDASRSGNRALELNPLDLTLLSDSQWNLIGMSRYGEAASLGRKALEKNPQAALVRGVTGLASALDGHVEEGIADLKQALSQEDTPSFRVLLALGLAVSGRGAESREVLAGVEKVAGRKYVCSYEMASVHAVLGNDEDAYRWFRKAVADRCDCLVWLKVEPWLHRLQSTPRFARLLAVTGLDAAKALH